jgi:hypothetical protein
LISKSYQLRYGRADLAPFSTKPEKLGFSTNNQGFQAATIPRNPVFGVGARSELIHRCHSWFTIEAV